MSTPAKRRKSHIAPQDSLRPGWVVNCILFCVMLACIGGCYVWLGAKKKVRADQILSMHREIGEYTAQIGELDMQISRRLSPENLRARVADAKLDLQPIDNGTKGRLIQLPDPVISREPMPAAPVFAGHSSP
jgi:hypothetical protein